MTQPEDDSEKPTASRLDSAAGVPSLPSFPPDELLAGRFRIVRCLGQGGMGEVYEAEDLELREHVALKTIRSEIATDERAMERFRREIQLARKVTHPNVCRTFDIERHRASSGSPGEDVAFLTMELLVGETLAGRLRRTGRMAPAEAFPLVSQMVAGLAAAHGEGIVHRDFKPGNVVLVPSEGKEGGFRAVVTDFGLARQTVAPGPQADITGTGSVVGTAAYMSPEQVEGGEITSAADVYALGIVMYEMVTGARPFAGDSFLSTAVKRLKEPPPPPRTHVPDLDPTWEAVILRCLERDPADRFARVEDVAKALRGGSVARGRRTRRQRTLGLAAALIVVLGVGFALSRVGRPVARPESAALPAPPKAPRRSVAVLGFKNLSGRPEAAWLSTALSEMLGSELAAGGTLLLIPGENVARMRVELSLPEAETLAQDTMARVRKNLGADVVVTGSYIALGERAAGRIRLDLRVQDAVSGEALAPVIENGRELDLPEMVARAGAQLRGLLGVGGVSQAEAQEARASFPSNREASRLYAEGLSRLRLFDALAARDLLAKAVAADPSHPLAHSALADAWSALDYDARAREEARRAFELSTKLSREERLFVEGHYREAVGDWDKAAEIYRALWKFFPDNLEYGLRLAAALKSAGKGNEALAVVEALRKLPPPAREDPRIDLAEVAVAEALSDFKRERAAAARAAEKARTQGARLLLARALQAEGWALGRLGDPQRARASTEEARQIFEAAGDRGGLANALNRLAMLLSDQGDLAGARGMFEDALAIYRERGSQSGMAAVLNNLAVLLWEGGDLDGAARRYEESLAIFREIADKDRMVTALGNLGLVLEDRGELAAARRVLEESLPTSRAVGNKAAEAIALFGLGGVLAGQGDLAGGRRHYEESLEIPRGMDQRFVAYDLFGLGEVLSKQGDLAGARRRHEEALGIRSRLGAKLAVAESRLALAVLSIEEGRPAAAEDPAREAALEFHGQKAASKEALARAALALSLLRQGKVGQAKEEAERASGLTTRTQDRAARLSVAITMARVRAGQEKAAEAVKSLEATLTEAHGLGLLGLELEARLALGEVGAGSRDPATARLGLEALERDAKARGFGLIAGKAAGLLARIGPRPPSASRQR